MAVSECLNCGGTPKGEGCSHQCYNSPHYYSPEQERYDDMIDDGSDDMRERYAATAEPSQYEDHQWDDDEFLPEPRSNVRGQVVNDPDDIPF